MIKVDVIVAASFAKHPEDVDIFNSLVIIVDPESKTKGLVFWRGAMVEATVDAVDRHSTHPSATFTMHDGKRKMGGKGNLMIYVGNENLTIYGMGRIFAGRIPQVNYNPATKRITPV